MELPKLPTLDQGQVGAVVRHPLEPLTAEEVQTAVALLKAAGRVNDTTRFISIALREPDKAVVQAPSEGRVSREAEAVLFDNAANACHEARLSLTDRELVSWRHVPGVQPTMTADEQAECEQAVISSAGVSGGVEGAHRG